MFSIIYIWQYLKVYLIFILFFLLDIWRLGYITFKQRRFDFFLYLTFLFSLISYPMFIHHMFNPNILNVKWSWMNKVMVDWWIVSQVLASILRKNENINNSLISTSLLHKWFLQATEAWFSYGYFWFGGRNILNMNHVSYKGKRWEQKANFLSKL